MEKLLIYFTLGNHQEYDRIAELCLASLNTVGYTGDIVIITDRLIDDLRALNANISTFDLGPSDLANSSANKLRIGELAGLTTRYDKVIYCDLDMLWIKSPIAIFDMITRDDKVYLSEEPGMMTERFFSQSLATVYERDRMQNMGIHGLNAGFMGFKPRIALTLQHIHAQFASNPRLECLEQPFINLTLWRHHCYDTSIGKFIAGTENFIDDDSIVVHFSGNPGKYEDKLARMTKFLESRK